MILYTPLYVVVFILESTFPYQLPSRSSTSFPTDV